jgi:hypothetical protein
MGGGAGVQLLRERANLERLSSTRPFGRDQHDEHGPKHSLLAELATSSSAMRRDRAAEQELDKMNPLSKDASTSSPGYAAAAGAFLLSGVPHDLNHEDRA